MRREKNNITKENQRETNSSRCGCKFAIRYSTSRKYFPSEAPKGAVRITDRSLYRHTHECFPSQSQLIVEKKKAGHYETGVERAQLQSNIEVLRPGKPVSCRLLREVMRPLYPGTYAIEAQDVCNMRLKVKRILERKEKGDEASGLSTSDQEDLLRKDDGLADEEEEASASRRVDAPVPRRFVDDNEDSGTKDPAKTSYSDRESTAPAHLKRRSKRMFLHSLVTVEAVCFSCIPETKQVR